MEQKLYKLPERWEWRTVKELSQKVQYGHTTKAKSSGNAKFLRITDIQNGRINWETVPLVSVSSKDLAKYKLQTNDLVFARSGATSGKSILIEKVPENAIFASYLIRIIPTCGVILPEFLALFFQSPTYWQQVETSASGAAQPNINGSKLSGFNVPLPSLNQQERIVEKLNALFTRIDTAINHLQDNLKFSKDLFASVQQSLFDGLEDDCEVLSLEDVCTITSSKRILKSDYVDDGIPFFRTKEIVELSKSEEISLELFIPYDQYQQIKEKFGVPQKGDLLFSAVGTIGITWIVDERIFYFKDGNLLWLKDFSGVDVRFLRESISAVLAEKIRSKSQGAAYKAISIRNLKAFKIPLPPLDEQHRIVTKLSVLSERVRAIEAATQEKLHDLENLKSSLLDNAFRGQL